MTGLEVVQASFHDYRSRRVEETVDEYRWAEVVAPDSHDASCSPQGEDSMKVRGEYSQGGMEVVGLRRETWLDLRHFLGVRNLDPEGNLEFLDLGVDDAKDMIEEGVVEEDMGIDGPCPEVVDDVLRNHCTARESGSTPVLEAAYLRLVEEDSCTT